MKLLITGSRQFTDYEGLKLAIAAVEKERGKAVTLLLHGGAKGADTLAHRYAEEMGIEVEVILPDYKSHHGKQAPLKRNEELVKRAEVVLALYGPRGRKGGTYYTAQKAMMARKPLTERLADGTLLHNEPELILALK